MNAVVLKVVDPFIDLPEGSAYRSCDFCYETVVEDIWAGRLKESEWRRFYELPDGCTVCDNCLPTVDLE